MYTVQNLGLRRRAGVDGSALARGSSIPRNICVDDAASSVVRLLWSRLLGTRKLNCSDGHRTYYTAWTMSIRDRFKERSPGEGWCALFESANPLHCVAGPCCRTLDGCCQQGFPSYVSEPSPSHEPGFRSLDDRRGASISWLSVASNRPWARAYADSVGAAPPRWLGQPRPIASPSRGRTKRHLLVVESSQSSSGSWSFSGLSRERSLTSPEARLHGHIHTHHGLPRAASFWRLKARESLPTCFAVCLFCGFIVLYIKIHGISALLRTPVSPGPPRDEFRHQERERG